MLTGWKTLIVGLLVTVVGVLQGTDWLSLIPNNPTVVGWITSGLGVAMVVLRFFTSTSVGKSA